jgi:hypothetical protein
VEQRAAASRGAENRGFLELAGFKVLKEQERRQACHAHEGHVALSCNVCHELRFLVDMASKKRIGAPQEFPRRLISTAVPRSDDLFLPLVQAIKIARLLAQQIFHYLLNNGNGTYTGYPWVCPYFFHDFLLFLHEIHMILHQIKSSFIRLLRK